MKRGYVVVDLETTGLSAYNNKITEIAAARVIDGKIIDEFQTLVNPKVPIPSFITRLTGISNDMVKDAPKINQALPNFLSFLKDDLFIAHNATFDYNFLSYNSNILNHNFNNKKLCTRKLASRILPNLPNKKLSTLCDHFNIKNSQAHRALSDVRATVKVFENMLDILNQKNIQKKEDILQFEQFPIRKCYEILQKPIDL